MIDIENKVTDTIIRAVKNDYPSAVVEDRFNPTPSALPYAAVYELSNTTYTQSRDNLNRELYANITYEVQVFANDKYKKATAKAIADLIDSEMLSMGFVRTFKNPIPNVDRTIYRIAMRYAAIVQEGIQTDKDTITYYLHQ